LKISNISICPEKGKIDPRGTSGTTPKIAGIQPAIFVRIKRKEERRKKVFPTFSPAGQKNL
jgi:hypothetical protein